MEQAKNAQAPPSFSVRILSALYGEAERIPSWAFQAWAEGWRPVLRDYSKAHDEETR